MQGNSKLGRRTPSSHAPSQQIQIRINIKQAGTDSVSKSGAEPDWEDDSDSEGPATVGTNKEAQVCEHVVWRDGLEVGSSWLSQPKGQRALAWYHLKTNYDTFASIQCCFTFIFTFLNRINEYNVLICVEKDQFDITWSIMRTRLLCQFITQLIYSVSGVIQWMFAGLE